MRALFKQILKASGTPVLQTRRGGEEIILSAGNIWTSAHARRIELCDRGLAPGAVVCSDASAFQAIIDFVACTIGGFVYVPVTPGRLRALQRQVAMQPIRSAAGIAFIGGPNAWDHHPDLLPSSLAGLDALDEAQLVLFRDTPDHIAGFTAFTGKTIEAWLGSLSVRLKTPAGGTRLSYGSGYHDPGFVVDLLLGITNRQTIYLRDCAETSSRKMLSEMLELGVDDLVLVPRMLDGLAREAQQTGIESRKKIRAIRLHSGGHTLSPRHLQVALSCFSEVLVETPPEVSGTIYTSPPNTQKPQLNNVCSSRLISSAPNGLLSIF
jgi:hypothetical protein